MWRDCSPVTLGLTTMGRRSTSKLLKLGTTVVEVHLGRSGFVRTGSMTPSGVAAGYGTADGADRDSVPRHASILADAAACRTLCSDAARQCIAARDAGAIDARAWKWGTHARWRLDVRRVVAARGRPAPHPCASAPADPR